LTQVDFFYMNKDVMNHGSTITQNYESANQALISQPKLIDKGV